MTALTPLQADVFAAIADGTRRAVLRTLAEDGEKTVTELMTPFAMSQPAVSKHLRCLREAGLVTRRKEGRLGYYSLNAERLKEVHDWVSYFEKYWDEKLGALGDYLDKQKQERRAKTTRKKTK